MMLRRKKTSYFIDAKETTTVVELKKMLRGITKQPIEDMKFYRDDVVSRVSFLPVHIGVSKRLPAPTKPHRASPDISPDPRVRWVLIGLRIPLLSVPFSAGTES